MFSTGTSRQHKANRLKAVNTIFNNISNKINHASSTSHHIGKRQKLSRSKYKHQRENPRPKEESIHKRESWIITKEIWFDTTFKHGSILDLDRAPKMRTLISAGAVHGVLTKYDGLKISTTAITSWSIWL